MQTKKQSFIEAVWNGVFGTFVGVIVWYSIIQPLANILHWNLSNLLIYQAISVNSIYIIINITKTWLIRRFFNSKDGKNG